MSEVGAVGELPIFWISATHRGSIRRLNGTAADGTVHGLGIWIDCTELRTGRRHSVPCESVAEALESRAEKYEGFHVIAEPDVVEMVIDHQGE